ncbi:MAG: Flp family type IVb pilin [Emcibacteraceae bacterium]|nr:Flp family type IVb pilin [Alphaproteobacteria bacterium]HPF46294.1 Flp family type IVb pilin [Emcibacteraceae bacterium]HRW29079.1 Flp family type IVb pilin [Emcibacteraceae bacterium]
MTKLFAKLRKSEKGATAIEYGLIAALISIAGIAGMKAIGPQLQTTFSSVGTELTNANT